MINSDDTFESVINHLYNMHNVTWRATLPKGMDIHHVILLAMFHSALHYHENISNYCFPLLIY